MGRKKLKKRTPKYAYADILAVYKEVARASSEDLAVMTDSARRVYMLNAVSRRIGSCAATVRNKIDLYRHIRVMRKYVK